MLLYDFALADEPSVVVDQHELLVLDGVVADAGLVPVVECELS